MGLRNSLQAILAKASALIGGSGEKSTTRFNFVDLAPTDKADTAGVYSDALLFATNNPRVSNIALTGPYGSGKSSIIRSFLTRYKRPTLQISLAAFLPEAAVTGGDVSKQEIERSILQQMLYGADANKLPLSRFKRIQSPGGAAALISFYIVLGLLSCWYVSQKSNEIISGAFFLPFAISNWLNLISFLIAVSFLCIASHYFYVASFGLSLKSFSLKNIEITPTASAQDSILNRHLDEIIYFFQSTKYDLVVIEDLDRFNNPEIFVTLREINSLVNANSGVHRTIRFLYALRDDMFTNVDRTKFFEFIIPVIPIISSSNSIDMVLAQGKRLALNDRLNRQFLREVSRYLNDLRLIQNIFNEYAIYIANLETRDEQILNPNKLLAVLIYKNVFPRDFENLHRRKGALSGIINRHDEFISISEAECKAEIARLEASIDTALLQMPSNLRDLRRIYAMALIESLPAAATHVGLSGQSLVVTSSLSTHETFDQIIESARVTYRDLHGHQPTVDVSAVQSGVDATRTFKQRVSAIEASSAANINATRKAIAEVRSRLSTLRFSKFNETIRRNSSALEREFELFGENIDLAKFLIFEGYLDDTYYQYTSLFHSGRLSPNDNSFLIKIRGFLNPEADFQIDNPKEVIAAMRDEDFLQEYVLNVKIVDCLLEEPATFAHQTAKLFQFIASDFKRCEAFFVAYYATGVEVPALVAGLAKTWAGFVPAAISSSKSVSHVARIISQLPLNDLEQLALKYPVISAFVSANLAHILGSEVDIDTARLKVVATEIPDLSTVKDYPGVARFLFQEGMYELTAENIEVIFQSVFGLDDLRGLQERHYTTVLGTDNTALISRISGDFESYFKDIILQLDDNSQEELPAVLAIMAHEEIDPDDLRTFIAKQSVIIPSLDQVPERLKALVFDVGKIAASWENCLAFLASEDFDAQTLTSYLDAETVRAVLSSQAVPGGEDAYKLRHFLIEADGLRDEVYRSYVQLLPKPFPKVSESLGVGKLRILIDERKLVFSKENMDFLFDSDELDVLFAARNIDNYLSISATFEHDDDFREQLLHADISHTSKLAIVGLMDMSLLADLPDRAAVVGPILDSTEIDISRLDVRSARAIIVSSQPVHTKISLLNKCQRIFSDEDVRNTLAELPLPFSEITIGYHTPWLKLTEENISLATWLGERKLISSWRRSAFGDEIRINLYRR